MSADPSDEYIAYRKLNNYHQTIVITFDIKNIMLVAYIVSRKKINPLPSHRYIWL